MRKFAGVIAGVLVAVFAAGFLSDGANAAANDLVVTGPGEGGTPNIRTFGPDGKDGGTSYNANGSGTSGARVAAGDITGDGVSEIVTGTGPGVDTMVQVWSGDGATLVAQTNPFPGFQGGVFVAAANEDESNALEVIVGAGAGGGPHVKVLRLVNGQLQTLYSFYAYHPDFRGGVHVAASGGRIITGPGAGGGPHVRVFRIFLGELSVANEWYAYHAGFTGGVYVAAGSVRSTAIDIVTGAGSGGGPHVKLFSLEGVEGPGFMAYDPAFRGGVRVAVGMGQHLITAAGPGGGPHVLVRKLRSSDGALPVVASFYAYAATFNGGVFAGGFLTSPLPPTTTTTCLLGPLLCSGGETTTTTTTTTAPPPTTTTSTTSTTTSTTSTSTSTTTSTTSTSTTTTTTSDGGGLPLP